MNRTPAPALAVALLAVVLAVAPRPARGAWPHDPGVNQPICTAVASQARSVIVPDGEGGAIFAWQDGRNADWDIYAQRVSATGEVLWTTNGVPLCLAASIQAYPVIVADGVGGAIVAWQDERSGPRDIYAQHVSADGEVQWTPDGVAVCAAVDEQMSPVIVTNGEALSGGAMGAIVVWLDYRNGTHDVYAQRISTYGALQWIAEGVPLCVAPGDQYEPRAITDGAGGALVAWYDGRGLSNDIYAQRIQAGGSVAWQSDGVALCSAPGEQQGPTLAPDGAGGAIVAWFDHRNSEYDIFAQRVSSNGTPQWAPDGVALCTGNNAQWFPTTCSDGLGGAFVAWQDYRSGDWDIYAQRVSAAGAPQWTANGQPACTVTGDQVGPQVAPDGLGGLLLAWQDTRTGTIDLYAQRTSPGGSAQWVNGGVAVCTASGEQLEPRAVADGSGGSIITWWDGRIGDWDIFAQRVDRWGVLGAEPVIASVRDVPNDQGGQVKLSWDASPLDTDVLFENIGTYRVYRSVPPAAALQALASGQAVVEGGAASAGRRVLLVTTAAAQDHYWEYLGSVPGDHLSGYSSLAPTTADSLPGSNPLTLFLVQARSADGTRWWNSAPDSGYSVDDLAPVTPALFTGEYADGTTRMSWGANTEADFAAYRLYRGHEPDFAPDPGTLLAELTERSFADPAGAPAYYRLCAVDVHGNASGFSTLLPSGTVDVPGGALPREVFLAPPAPNPARGAATLRFGLPREARVELALYDQAGRRVRSLLGGTQPAGERAIRWDGRDEDGRALPAGLYFVRLATEGRTFVSRLAVIR